LREVGGEGVEAENLEADGDEPVGEGSLLHVADAVDVEGDPVSGEDDVAGSAGVGGVGVVKKRGREEGGKEEDDPKADEDEECVCVMTVDWVVTGVGWGAIALLTDWGWGEAHRRVALSA
jgi:hypothetical protein